MKSLKERLADKAAIKAKEDAKLSGPVNCFVVRIPWCGAPDVRKDSDLNFLKQRASEVVAKIRHNAAYQFYEAMKEAIEPLERNAAARRRPGIWSREVSPTTPPLCAPPPGADESDGRFTSIRLNANGTITDMNGTVYSPNETYPNPPTGIRGVLSTDALVFTADGSGTQFVASTPMITPTVPTPPTNEERPLAHFERDGITVPFQSPPTGVSEAVNNLLNSLPIAGEALSHTVANNVIESPVNLSAEEVEQLESLTPAQRGDELTPEEEDAILQPGEAPHTVSPPVTIALRPGENSRSALIRYYSEQLRPIAGCAEGIVIRPSTLSTPLTNEHTDQCHCTGCEESRHGEDEGGTPIARVSEDDPRNPHGER